MTGFEGGWHVPLFKYMYMVFNAKPKRILATKCCKSWLPFKKFITQFICLRLNKFFFDQTEIIGHILLKILHTHTHSLTNGLPHIWIRTFLV